MTVADQSRPTISNVPVPITVAAVDATGTPATDAAIVAFLAQVTATDNVGVTSLTNNGPAQYPVGPTTVTWTASDLAGNITTVSSTVTVNPVNQGNTPVGNNLMVMPDPSVSITFPTVTVGGQTDVVIRPMTTGWETGIRASWGKRFNRNLKYDITTTAQAVFPVRICVTLDQSNIPRKMRRKEKLQLREDTDGSGQLDVWVTLQGHTRTVNGANAILCGWAKALN